MAETKDLAEDEVRVLRDELSHIADALGVASYGGCYEQAEVLERAKALAKRVEELECLLRAWRVHQSADDERRCLDRLWDEALKLAEGKRATRRAGRASS